MREDTNGMTLINQSGKPVRNRSCAGRDIMVESNESLTISRANLPAEGWRGSVV